MLLNCMLGMLEEERRSATAAERVREVAVALGPRQSSRCAEQTGQAAQQSLQRASLLGVKVFTAET